MSKLEQWTDWLAERLNTNNEVHKQFIRDALSRYAKESRPKKLIEQSVAKEFLDAFNSVTGRNFRAISSKIAGQLSSRIKEGYTMSDFKYALEGCMDDEFHKENKYRWVTPEYITRGHILDRYMNRQVDVKLDDYIIPNEFKMLKSTDELKKMCQLGKFKKKIR